MKTLKTQEKKEGSSTAQDDAQGTEQGTRWRAEEADEPARDRGGSPVNRSEHSGARSQTR